MNAPTTAAVVSATPQPPSLIHRFAARFGVEPNKMLVTIKATAFRQKPGDPEVTNEQLMALMVVAEQYGLNPWTKEIYAFPDKGGIVPVVGVDGWSRIINEHPQFDGVDFVDAESADGAPPAWIECTIHRKDRAHPTTVREYMAECKRGTGPWGSHPRRMLRHKALMQCARVAFGYVGIYDQDEAERIVDGSVQIVMPEPSAVRDINSAVTGANRPAIDHQTGEVLPAVVGEGEGEKVVAGDQVVAAEEPKPAAAKPKAEAELVHTYAQVAERINKATTLDQLNEARDLIRSVKDAAHRRGLNDEAARRQKELEADDGK